MLSIIRGAALALAAFLYCSALFAQPDASKDIVVGQVLDQSGLAREVSRDYFAGAKVYFDSVNAKGGINGRKIRHLIRNDDGNPEKTVQITAELIERDNVDVLFGYVGDSNVRAAAGSPAFRKSGIALVGAISGDEFDAALESNVYFTRSTYADEAKRVVEHFHSLGIRSFALAYTATDFGVALRGVLIDALRQRGLAPVCERAVPTDSRDMKREAQALIACRPQVVVLLADTLPAAAFIKEYRALDGGAILAGTSLINHRALIELAGPKLAHGVLLTQVVPDPARLNEPLLLEHQRLMKQYLDEPPSHATLEGFIAAKTLVQALKTAARGAHRLEIAHAMKERRRYDLGGVEVDFAARGNRGYAFVDLTFLRQDGRLLY